METQTHSAPVWQFNCFAIWHQADADYYQCAHERSNAWHDIGPHCDTMVDALKYLSWYVEDTSYSAAIDNALRRAEVE